MTSRMVRIVIGTVTFTVPVTLTVLDVFGYVAKVEGISMQPSLNPDVMKKCDYVFLNKWAARHQPLHRGEVVSLISPNNASQRLIKRIIGKEGDTVKTLNHKSRYVRVPEGHCWVEGDHHGHSLDSNLFGPVALSLIQAKASTIVWPPSRWRRIEIEPGLLVDRLDAPIDPNKTRHTRVVFAKDNEIYNEIYLKNEHDDHEAEEKER